MRDDVLVAVPELVPRRTIGGIIAVWVVAALVGVAVGVFSGPEARVVWLIIALALCLVLSFAVQLWYGRSQGFTERVAASVLGSMLVLGLISLGFGLATIVPG